MNHAARAMPYGSMWMRRLALAAPWWFERQRHWPGEVQSASGAAITDRRVPPPITAEYRPPGWRSYSLRSGEEAQQCSTVSTLAASGGQCGRQCPPNRAALCLRVRHHLRGRPDLRRGKEPPVLLIADRCRFVASQSWESRTCNQHNAMRPRPRHCRSRPCASPSPRAHLATNAYCSSTVSSSHCGPGGGGPATTTHPHAAASAEPHSSVGCSAPARTTQDSMLRHNATQDNTLQHCAARGEWRA